MTAIDFSKIWFQVAIEKIQRIENWSWEADEKTRDVVQPPIFVTTTIKKNKKKILSHGHFGHMSKHKIGA